MLKRVGKMKFTLKNRPITENKFIKLDPSGRFQVWFEGFEKELRERLGDGVHIQGHYLWVYIKEILGE